MSKIAIVEDGKVTYRGKLPTNFRNSNMNCTGLDKATPESLIKKGILPLEIVPPVYDSTTHKIDGFTDTIEETKVIQTWSIRPKTQVEIDTDITIKATEYQTQREMMHIPISDQLDMMYWDEINNTNIWKDYVTDIKTKFPKP